MSEGRTPIHTAVMAESAMKTFLIESELKFTELLYGEDVVEMAEKVYTLGLDMQLEKRRVLSRNLRIEYLKEVERMEEEERNLKRKRLREKRESGKEAEGERRTSCAWGRGRGGGGGRR